MEEIAQRDGKLEDLTHAAKEARALVDRLTGLAARLHSGYDYLGDADHDALLIEFSHRSSELVGIIGSMVEYGTPGVES